MVYESSTDSSGSEALLGIRLYGRHPQASTPAIATNRLVEELKAESGPGPNAIEAYTQDSGQAMEQHRAYCVQLSNATNSSTVS